MKHLTSILLSLVLSFTFLVIFTPSVVHAETPSVYLKESMTSLAQWMGGTLPSGCVLRQSVSDAMQDDSGIGSFNAQIGAINKNLISVCKDGSDAGVLNIGGRSIAMLYENTPSSEEYIADLMQNIGLPTATSAYAQGTGYTVLKPFLEFWKVFRNLAYSVYILMFFVIGIMIMLRTKVNAQTIISIQSALPNLVITLLLITFSYAIVGFMIDLMYFLIFFSVYLFASSGVIQSGQEGVVIDRLLNYSAWSVIFEGRNSVISAISTGLEQIIGGLGTGVISVGGALVNFFSSSYLIVAVAFAISMIKLMIALLRSYVMLLVQLVTAPIQIMLNALPGSKAFSGWLKTTASYLIPFPVAACMILVSAIFVGDPSKSTIAGKFYNAFGLSTQDDNPFKIDSNHVFYTSQNTRIWTPPLTLTGSTVENGSLMTILGFVVFLMTPSAIKMAQDWFQVKESPYTAEAFGSIGMGVNAGIKPVQQGWSQQMHHLEMEKQAKIFKNQGAPLPGKAPGQPGIT